MNPTQTADTPAARFADLAPRWLADASPGSPAGREILALREPAIRLILAELEARPDPRWHALLVALTGEDPVTPGDLGDADATVGAWIAWGRQEEADRAEAIRITPGGEALRRIARRPASTIDYSREDDELPC